MKKFLGAATSAVMLAGGAVALASSPAQAACPYSGCIATSTFIDAPDEVKRGNSAEICIRVGTDGNGQAKGTVTITVVRGKGGFEFTDSKKYNDRRECFETPALRQLGNYVIKARFDKKPGSRWKDSDNRDEFQVVRRG